MNKKKYIIVCLFLAIILISVKIDATTVNEVLNSKVDEVKTNIDNTNEDLNNVNTEITSVSDEVQKLNNQIAQYQTEVQELNIQIAQLEVDIKDATAQLEEAQVKYEKQKKLLEKRIIAIYEAGDTVYLDVLLHSKSIKEFISNYYYLLEISNYDKEILNDITEQRNEIENKKNSLINKQEKLKSIASNKEKTNITLSNIKTVRDSYLSKLTQKEQELQEKLQTYEEEMELLESQILRISLASLGEDYVGGNFIWPVPGYYTVTSTFGMRIHPIFKVKKLHTGTDIGAPSGTSVVAANGGVVIEATYSSSYGYYVMIDHGGGMITLYGHSSKLLVSEGDVVKQGDVIMEVGSTGWSTGPHLHFEIRVDGNKIDPLPYISGLTAEEIIKYDETENAVS